MSVYSACAAYAAIVLKKLVWSSRVFRVKKNVS